MAVSVPKPNQIRQIAERMGLNVTEADIDSFIGLMTPSIDAYNVVDALPDNLPEVKYPRNPGYRVPPEENKYNAWYWRTSILSLIHI